jgi:Zn finger protein HypA/HybF involved in hydrogenase expression
MGTVETAKPCPKCGSTELSNEGHFVQCDKCGTKGEEIYPVPDSEEAIRKWNALNVVSPNTVTKEHRKVRCPHCKKHFDLQVNVFNFIDGGQKL